MALPLMVVEVGEGRDLGEGAVCFQVVGLIPGGKAYHLYVRSLYSGVCLVKTEGHLLKVVCSGAVVVEAAPTEFLPSLLMVVYLPHLSEVEVQEASYYFQTCSWHLIRSWYFGDYCLSWEHQHHLHCFHRMALIFVTEGAAEQCGPRSGFAEVVEEGHHHRRLVSLLVVEVVVALLCGYC